MKQIKCSKLLKDTIINNLYHCEKNYYFTSNVVDSASFNMHFKINHNNINIINDFKISNYWFSGDVKLKIYNISSNIANTDFLFTKEIKTNKDILEVKKCFDIFDLQFDKDAFDQISKIIKDYEKLTDSLEKAIELNSKNIKILNNLSSKFNLVFA